MPLPRRETEGKKMFISLKMNHYNYMWYFILTRFRCTLELLAWSRDMLRCLMWKCSSAVCGTDACSGNWGRESHQISSLRITLDFIAYPVRISLIFVLLYFPSDENTNIPWPISHSEKQVEIWEKKKYCQNKVNIYLHYLHIQYLNWPWGASQDLEVAKENNVLISVQAFYPGGLKLIGEFLLNIVRE